MTVRIDVSGMPAGGSTTWHVVFDAGRLVTCGSGPGVDPGLTLSVKWGDAQRIADGDLDANAAFMAGLIKTDGPTRPLLALLGALQTPAARTCLSGLSQER